MILTSNQIEQLIHEAGFPAKRANTRRWRIRFETGLITLFIEFVQGPTLFWVRTHGYLPVPSRKQHDAPLMEAILGADTGMARFRNSSRQGNGLHGVEITSSVPQKELTAPLIRELTSAVVETAVWHSPWLEALIRDLPMPPSWTKGQDLSLGIRWSKDTM